jgi:hypothetical protein
LGVLGESYMVHTVIGGKDEKRSNQTRHLSVCPIFLYFWFCLYFLFQFLMGLDRAQSDLAPSWVPVTRHQPQEPGCRRQSDRRPRLNRRLVLVMLTIADMCFVLSTGLRRICDTFFVSDSACTGLLAAWSSPDVFRRGVS